MSPHDYCNCVQLTKPLGAQIGVEQGMASRQPPGIFSAIEQKLEWALCAYRERGRDLLTDGPVVGLLDRLSRAAFACQSLMAELGIAELCRRCEQTQGGSCCAAGLEDKYGSALVLINLLLGVRLPEARPDPRSCFFLGQEGCVLVAREVICVNYLCTQVTRHLEPRRLTPLRQIEGEQLDALYSLQQLIERRAATW